MRLLNNIIFFFRSKDDPVHHCAVYKKDRCAHVDGPLCNIKTCNILSDYHAKLAIPLYTGKDD